MECRSTFWRKFIAQCAMSTAASAASWLAPAVAAAGTPTAYLQYGGIVGQGSTIFLSRIPVTNSTGQTFYYDGSITFAVGSGGILTTPPTVALTASPSLNTAHFVAGRYFAPSGASPYYALGTLTSGVGSGASTVWIWTEDTSAPSNGAPFQAVWQTGSPAPDIAARLSAAKVPNNPTYSYGYAAIGNFSLFCSNGLLAAQQVANTITLVSYSACGDSSTQKGSVILKMCVDTKCSNASP